VPPRGVEKSVAPRPAEVKLRRRPTSDRRAARGPLGRRPLRPVPSCPVRSSTEPQGVPPAVPALLCPVLRLARRGPGLLLPRRRLSRRHHRPGRRNGVGKSTLLRVLAGELAPTAGSMPGTDRIGDDNALRAQLARFLLDAATITRPVATLPAVTASGRRWGTAAQPAGAPAARPGRADQQPGPRQRRSSPPPALPGVSSPDEPFLAELVRDRRIDLGSEPHPVPRADPEMPDRCDF
jgi:hypothetical protein